MKNYTLKLVLKILAFWLIIIGLCLILFSCNTQKRITLTDQKITYKIDTVIQIKKIPIKIKTKPITKIIYQLDTIKIETIRYKVKTFYDTVYKNIVTKVQSKSFELPIKINKTVETKTKEKIKEKEINNTIIKIGCLISLFMVICFILLNIIKKKLL